MRISTNTKKDNIIYYKYEFGRTSTTRHVTFDKSEHGTVNLMRTTNNKETVRNTLD